MKQCTMINDGTQCTNWAVSKGLCAACSAKKEQGKAPLNSSVVTPKSEAIKWTHQELKKVFGSVQSFVDKTYGGEYGGGNAGQHHVHKFVDSAHLKQGNKERKFWQGKRFDQGMFLECIEFIVKTKLNNSKQLLCAMIFAAEASGRLNAASLDKLIDEVNKKVPSEWKEN
ncbi:MAG: hypothetical protein PHH11_03765 [Methylomonas sp.]|nr:hypothetical protein [Methylomonas sp.]